MILLPSIASALRLATIITLACAGHSQAATFLSQNISGSFVGSTTLGGVGLGNVTDFTLQATFDGDPSGDLYPSPSSPQAAYALTSLSITIAGYGTYESSSYSSYNVFLGNPVRGGFPWYAAGLEHKGGFPLDLPILFRTTTPTLNAHAPAPTVFGQYVGFLSPSHNHAFHLDLTGVTGGLDVPDAGVVSI